MKKLRGNLAVKISAVILLCVMALLFAASAATAVMLGELGAYSGGYESGRKNMLQKRCQQRTYEAADRVLAGGEKPESVFAQENFRFAIYDDQGQLLYSNWDGAAALAQAGVQYALTEGEPWREHAARLQEESLPTVTPTPRPTAQAQADPVATPVPTAHILEASDSYVIYEQGGELHVRPQEEMPFDWQLRTYRVDGYIPEALEAEDEIAHAVRIYDGAYRLRYTALVAAALSFLLGVLLFVFLCAAAGHRDAGERITPSFVDKIPFDLFTLLMLGALALPLSGLDTRFNIYNDIAGILLCSLLFLCAGLLFLLWCLSLAVRAKLGVVWKGCLCYRLLRWLGGGLRGLGRGLAALVRSLPLLRRWLLILALCWLAWLGLMAMIGIDGEIFFLWFVEHLILTALALYLLLGFRRLRLGAKAIAGGDEGYIVDSRHLVWELKEHAEDLNHIRDGLSAAVAERVKSERFRTELITNVSHDIRTPLTSIINYVDLLEKEAPENERQREYVAVLSRQSARLKKLIDDLMEASKAATGNLPVDKQPCQLGVLLDQTAGEYGERLAAAGLELVLSKPDKPMIILADGRHMWRIFDNLMLNILKYAQPGTRVYLDLQERQNRAAVSFRNISRSQLNISGEELMERFVRGDGARNTEGSGLGLSIARSLTQLQGGEMELTVDGDLFKVTLLFERQ